MWKTGRKNGGRLGRGLDSAAPTSDPHTGGRGQTRITTASPTVAGEGAHGRETLTQSFASVFSVFTENEELGRSESREHKGCDGVL